MRTWLSGLALWVAASVVAQTFHTKAFHDQDFHSPEWPTIERYGLNEGQIVKMGHDKFVKWFCDESRAKKDGRVQAEKVYGLALNECAAPLLEKTPRKDQPFFEDVLTALADTAKSAFVTGMNCTKESDDWSLQIAESSTAVSEAMYLLLTPSVQTPRVPTEKMDELLAKLSAKLKAKDPKLDDGRVKFCVGHVEELFKNRSARDKAIARAFNLRMVKMSLSTPGES